MFVSSCKFCTYTLLTLLTKNLLLCYVLQPVSVVTTYVSPSSVISSSSTGGHTLTLTSSTDDESTTSSLTTVDITGMQPHGFKSTQTPSTAIESTSVKEGVSYCLFSNCIIFSLCGICVCVHTVFSKEFIAKICVFKLKHFLLFFSNRVIIIINRQH